MNAGNLETHNLKQSSPKPFPKENKQGGANVVKRDKKEECVRIFRK